MTPRAAAVGLGGDRGNERGRCLLAGRLLDVTGNLGLSQAAERDTDARASCDFPEHSLARVAWLQLRLAICRDDRDARVAELTGQK